jgi:threonine dehydratase
LISGIAVAIREMRPSARVYGVEPKHSNPMWEALRHQGPFALSSLETIADGLAARITEDLNYSIVSQYVEEIVEATLYLLEHAKVLAEPSGAASLAGLLANPKKKGKAVAVISGGNVTLEQIEALRRAPGF